MVGHLLVCDQRDPVGLDILVPEVARGQCGGCLGVVTSISTEIPIPDSNGNLRTFDRGCTGRPGGRGGRPTQDAGS